MKLCEHPDFAALVAATAQATRLNEQFVEMLFPGDFPSFADVLSSFEHLRDWL